VDLGKLYNNSNRLASILNRLPQLISSLAGRVIDQTTGEPIDGAAVELTSPESLGGLSRSSVTANDGAFIFKNLAKGAYVLSVSCFGYSTSNRRLEISDAQDITNMNIKLNNIDYPCNFSIKNETSEFVTTTFMDPGEPSMAPILLPSDSAVISGLDRPRRISAETFVLGNFGKRLHWDPFQIKCGGRNAVTLVDN